MTQALLQNIAVACGRTRGLQRCASMLALCMALCMILAACGSGSSGTTAGTPPMLPPPQYAELYQGDSFVPELASSNSDAPSEFHDWIRATGIAWFDATLQQRDTARAWLASDALVQVSDGLVEVSRK